MDLCFSNIYIFVQYISCSFKPPLMLVKDPEKGTRNSTRTKENKMFFALRPNYTEANIASYFICGNFQLRGNIQVTLLARRNRERERCYLKYKWSHVPLVQGYLMKLHYYSQGSIIQKLCPNG